MDGNRFDDLARSFAKKSSRRDLLRGLIGTSAVAIGGWTGLRSGGSRAQEGDATPELPTVEPVAPTAEPTFDPTAVVTNTATAAPSATATPSPTSTTVPTRSERGTATPTARPTEKAAQPALAATRTLLLSVTTGPVRTSVRADARGFAANEAIELRWYNGSRFSVLANLTASAGGRVVKTFSVPNSSRGSHRVRAQGTGDRADAFFTVKQSTKLTPTSGLAQSTTQVSLRGFRANTPVFVLFYPTDQRTGTPAVLASPTTSSTGSATVTVSIPEGSDAGRHRIEGKEQNSGTYAGTFFTVTCRGTDEICSNDDECCSKDCQDNGTCSCVFKGACTQDSDCCSVCEPESKTCCSGLGYFCGQFADCCPGTYCRPVLAVCGACLAVGAACSSDIECCGRPCEGGKCCVPEGGTCTVTADCCSGRCRREGTIGPLVCKTDVIG